MQALHTCNPGSIPSLGLLTSSVSMSSIRPQSYLLIFCHKFNFFLALYHTITVTHRTEFIFKIRKNKNDIPQHVGQCPWLGSGSEILSHPLNITTGCGGVSNLDLSHGWPACSPLSHQGIMLTCHQDLIFQHEDLIVHTIHLKITPIDFFR